MCLKHGKMCLIPAATERLFISGFDCKPFSTQNPRRFQEDAGKLQHPTLEACMDHIATRSPEVVLLENTSGLKFPSGGESKQPLLEQILGRLRSAHDESRNTTVVQASSHPLPTSRTRMLFYTAKPEVADRLAAEQQRLQQYCSRKPMHSCASMLTYITVPSKLSEDSAVAKASFQAQYQKLFAKCLQNAVQGNRLPKDTRVPPAHERFSQQFQGAPFITASIDVAGLIVKEAVAAQSPESAGPWLFDVSQSSNRGKFCLNGSCPTITTSTQLFDFRRSQMVDTESFFRIHGHRMNKLCLKEFTANELRRFAGNGMTTAMMVIGLTPVLLELGYLEKVPKA